VEIADHLTPARLRTLPSWSINQAAIAANRLTDRALAGAGARRYHFAMLAALDEFGPSSQADLGRCTGVDRSDVVAAINILAEQGYVDRNPDPGDGRRNVITITAAGTEYLERLDGLVADAQGELLLSWSLGERNRLIEQLTRIIDTHHETKKTPTHGDG
jgi:DNA-binding MarR family transcriptional regulator